MPYRDLILLVKGSLPRGFRRPGEPVSSSPGGLALAALPPSIQFFDVSGRPLWRQAFRGKTCLLACSLMVTFKDGFCWTLWTHTCNLEALCWWSPRPTDALEGFESPAAKTINFNSQALIEGPCLGAVEQERQDQGVVNPELRLAWDDDAARVLMWFISGFRSLLSVTMELVYFCVFFTLKSSMILILSAQSQTNLPVTVGLCVRPPPPPGSVSRTHIHLLPCKHGELPLLTPARVWRGSFTCWANLACLWRRDHSARAPAACQPLSIKRWAWLGSASQPRWEAAAMILPHTS